MTRTRSWLAPTLLGLVACLVAVGALWCTTGGGRHGPAPPTPPLPPDRGAPEPHPTTPTDATVVADSPQAGAEREVRLMARLRQAVDPRPRLALELARQAEARFPRSRLADERALLKMRALVHLEQIATARDEAVLFFKRFPNSPLAAQVQRLTGVHPRPRPGPRRGPSPSEDH